MTERHCVKLNGQLSRIYLSPCVALLWSRELQHLPYTANNDMLIMCFKVYQTNWIFVRRIWLCNYYSLQWCHAGVITSAIIRNSTVCFKLIEITTIIYHRCEVGTKYASLIFANMRLAILVPTSHRLKNIKAPHYWPLCRSFTADRWIPIPSANSHWYFFLMNYWYVYRGIHTTHYLR